jgi:hypothetical protein
MASHVNRSCFATSERDGWPLLPHAEHHQSGGYAPAAVLALRVIPDDRFHLTVRASPVIVKAMKEQERRVLLPDQISSLGEVVNQLDGRVSEDCRDLQAPVESVHVLGDR